MISVVVFKWSPAATERVRIPSQQRGTVYDAECVNRLFAALRTNSTVPFQPVCVTDDPAGIDPDIRTIPLWNQCRELGGCYNRLYVFSGDMREIIGPRFLCLDLDTVVVGNIDHLLTRPEPFVYYRWEAPKEPARFNCGLFLMDAGSRPEVWDEFIADPEAAIHKASHHEGSDQAWCNYRLDLIQEASFSRQADGIYDFRVDFLKGSLRAPPPGASLVMFPGPRDPRDSGLIKRFPFIRGGAIQE